MKKTSNLICGALATTMLFSLACDKQDSEITPEKIQTEKSANLEIEKLTVFLAKAAQIKETEVTFNKDNQQFYVYGIAQISLRDLTVSYEQNTKNTK